MTTENQQPEQSQPSQQVALATVQKQIAKAIEERGIPVPTWRTLAETLYPGASPNSVLMVWDYCQARNLDPMKKPVHIVPMNVKVGDQYVWRDTVLPGIYEYRITAHRTGEYMGHEDPVYGPEIEAFGVKAPETCKFVVYRWNEKAKQKVPYAVTVKFVEACGTKKKGQNDATQVANGRWQRAPVQMLTKCAEAAALREAFPEEMGGTPTVEEIEGHMPDVIEAEILDVKIPTSWERVSGALRDTLENAFKTLKMTTAQRLAKVNEYIPNDATADEGAEKLLEWCKDEFASQQGKTRKGADNSKTSQAPGKAVSSAASPPIPSKPNGGDSDSRPVGAEVVAGTDQPAASNQVTSTDIPFGKSKNGDPSKPPAASEFF